jgi:hypothetical protein
MVFGPREFLGQPIFALLIPRGAQDRVRFKLKRFVRGNYSGVIQRISEKKGWMGEGLPPSIPFFRSFLL